MPDSAHRRYFRPKPNRSQRDAVQALLDARTAVAVSSEILARAVAEARSAGVIEDEIAQALGVHRNTLVYRYGTRSIPAPRSES